MMNEMNTRVVSDGLRSRYNISKDYITEPVSKTLLRPKAKIAKKKKKKQFPIIISILCVIPSIFFIYVRFITTTKEASSLNFSSEGKLYLFRKLSDLKGNSGKLRAGFDELSNNSNNKPNEHIITPKKSTLRDRHILTAYLQPTENIENGRVMKPLPVIPTSADNLVVQKFLKVKSCSGMFETWPIDDYPETDPFLPWIHDVFPSSDNKNIHFVAQNRRRCMTGKGAEEKMKFWEPQMSLFQPVPVVKEGNDKIRLASSFDEATHNETRFICHFHTIYDNQVYETMSEFSFNYEYVSWRKGKDFMFQREGKDNVQFWLSQLLFRCPVPDEIQSLLEDGNYIDENDVSQIFVDISPIRTPARYMKHLFTESHIGSTLMSSISTNLFDIQTEFGNKHYLPALKDSGRWENIPICRPPSQPPKKKKHRLVLCTWTASAYTRRGDKVGISDTEARVREWILYHKMVGFDHIYLYDNTARGLDSDLLKIAQEFPDYVDYHRWPCSICNNNRPSHKNPGERSSQYAAEASCRERYGPTTDWMSFIDTDEYLIPMANDTWGPILDKFDEKSVHILKMRSSRGKPRIEFMMPMKNQSDCVDPSPQSFKAPGKPQDCLVPNSPNHTFLQVYNCEYIRPPKPDRFDRAMKQIYRPDYVQSHFVHYSTVTKEISKYAKYYNTPDETYVRKKVQGKIWHEGSPEIFLDEINEGMLVHARSVLPHESRYREQGCYTGSKYGCSMGYLCSDSTPFEDEKHKDNVFVTEDGKYCNCWKTNKIEKIYIPKLESLIQEHNSNLKMAR